MRGAILLKRCICVLMCVMSLFCFCWYIFVCVGGLGRCIEGGRGREVVEEERKMEMEIRLDEVHNLIALYPCPRLQFSSQARHRLALQLQNARAGPLM